MLLLNGGHRNSFGANSKANYYYYFQTFIFCLSVLLLRYFSKSVIPGSDCLWLGPVWGLPVCLLEALLDTMERAWTFSYHQRGPWASQSFHEPFGLTAHTQAAGVHSCGSPDAQPPWVVTLLHGQGAHSYGFCGIGRGSGDSCIPTTCGYGHTRGSYEDQSHISRHPTGRSEQEPRKWGSHYPSYAAADHRTSTLWSLNVWDWVCTELWLIWGFFVCCFILFFSLFLVQIPEFVCWKNYFSREKLTNASIIQTGAFDSVVVIVTCLLYSKDRKCCTEDGIMALCLRNYKHAVCWKYKKAMFVSDR